MIFTDVSFNQIRNLLKTHQQTEGYAYVGKIEDKQGYQGAVAVCMTVDSTEPNGIFVQSSIPIMLHTTVGMDGFRYQAGDVYSEGKPTEDNLIEEIYPYFAFELEELYTIANK